MGIKDRPVCLVLSRQALPTFDRTRYAAASGVARGGYILADAPSGKPDVLLLATGSEVSLCLDGPRAAGGRGDRCPSRQHAIVGDLRGATGGVPRQRVAAGGRSAGLGGSGLHLRLGQVHRPQGRDPGDALLRPLGADEGRRRALRLRARPRRHAVRPALERDQVGLLGRLPAQGPRRTKDRRSRRVDEWQRTGVR